MDRPDVETTAEQVGHSWTTDDGIRVEELELPDPDAAELDDEAAALADETRALVKLLKAISRKLENGWSVINQADVDRLHHAGDLFMPIYMGLPDPSGHERAREKKRRRGPP